MVISALLGWSLVRHGETVKEHARVQARMAVERDTFWREWNAGHGGVYVPVSKKTPPNPHLHVSERDITTPSGRRLTLVNPAYMTRQVYHAVERDSRIRGHLTSLKPKRPANAPDPWETETLKAFENGRAEVSSIERIAGEPYLRMMQVSRVKSSCLKCHGDQGYKIGDVRGGISVAVPMAPFEAVARVQEAGLWFGHGFVWSIGLVGICAASYLVEKRDSARRRNESERVEMLHDMQERVKELQCLYTASRSTSMRRTIEEIFKDVLMAIPPGCQYPDLTRGRIVFDGVEYVSEPFEVTGWKLSSDLIVQGRVRGAVEVYYTEACPQLDEGPFVNEEVNLIDSLAHMLSAAIERRLTEQALVLARDELRASNRELEKVSGRQ